jgi:methyl-accepting chemotaxis protein
MNTRHELMACIVQEAAPKHGDIQAPGDESVEVYAALLDTLCERLPFTAQLVEDSTRDLSLRFRELAESAKEQGEALQQVISLVTHVSIDDRKISLPEFLTTFRDLLSASVSQILYISKMAMAMVYSLDGAITHLHNVEEFIVRIQDINGKARMLALNATIEAARAAEEGRAFAVVAREIKDMSREIDTLSMEMQQNISSVTTSVREGYGMLKEVATIDMSGNVTAKENLERLVDCLLTQNTQLRSVIESSAAISNKTVETIGRMVVNMQFQDRNSQYIENSLRALKIMLEHMETRKTLQGYDPKTIMEVFMNAFSLSEFRQEFLKFLQQRNLTHEAMNSPVALVGVPEESVELF